MHSKPEKEMTEEELQKKENDRKHFHSYRDANKDGYIDRVMKWLHSVILISTIHPWNKRDAVTCLCRDEICPAIFQTWKKSGNWRLSLEKGLKVLSLFLKRHQVLYKWNFVHFGQISNSFLPVCVQRIMKGFVPAFFKVVIDHLLDNLSLEKEIIVYYFNGKKPGPSWILDPKICTNPDILSKQPSIPYCR